MEKIFTDISASITELKKNPTGLLAQAEGQVLEVLDDLRLAEIVQARQHDIAEAVEIALDDL